MHLRERAPPLIFWWLNTADNAIVADLYARTTTRANGKPPSSLPFFLDCSSIPKLVRATMRPGPANNPYRYPFHTRAHTPRVEETEARRIYEKGTEFGGEAIDPPLPRSGLWFSFSGILPPPFVTVEEQSSGKVCLLLLLLSLFCRKFFFFLFFFLDGFSKVESINQFIG